MSALRSLLSTFAVVSLTCASAASASVMLTFQVSNVYRNDCTGSVQPSCTRSAAAGFTQHLLFDGAKLTSSDGSVDAFRETSAAFRLPTLLDGTPYSTALSSDLSAPVTDDYSSVQLDNTYDGDSSAGYGSALIQWDHVSDTTSSFGVRTQQEYKLFYNLLSPVVYTTNWYTDLVNETADAFFQRYASLLTGSYDELGTAGSLDPTGLNFTSYAFTEYTGDSRLLSVTDVPEPDSLALSLIAFGGLLYSYRRRGARASNLA